MDIGRYVYIPAERGGDSYVHGVAPPTDGAERSTLGAHLSKRGCTFARLPWGGREAAALREVRGAGHVVAAQGVLATEEAARRALHDAGYVYLSTYALLDDEFPALSLVALTPSRPEPAGEQRNGDPGRDGLLTAVELLSLDAGAGLVSIGHSLRLAGDPLRGDGLVALIWAFTCAGVPSVTIAAPGAPDDPDVRFAKALFPSLAAGAAFDEAVRNALAQTSRDGHEGGPLVYLLYGRGEAGT
jgi:hypothetical protein